MSIISKIAHQILNNITETSFLRGGEFTQLNGLYHCDCSSYINSILKILDFSLYRNLCSDRSRLKAIDYFNLSSSNALISYHQKISNIRVGDILVWSKKNVPKTGDTGHMAIVLTLPILERKGVWRIQVSDSSKMIHDNDSRTSSGVGKGEMFLLEKNDEIIGYIWSTKRAKNKLCELRAITFPASLIE